jgi:DNA-binding HxlR family transcriptional regulator
MRKPRHKNCLEGCPVESTLDLIGGKWKGVALYHLMKNKKLRFNELKRKLPNITQRMLTKQLRELEGDGLVTRKIFAEIPPHVEYALSESGQSLSPIIQSLEAWGKKRLV